MIGFILILGLYYFLQKRKQSVYTVSDIIIYPIKSCGAIHLKSVKINEFGMLYDRQWVLITPDDKIVTQRDDTNLLKLQPVLHEKNDVLVSVDLIYENHKISFVPKKTGEILEFECMKAKTQGIDEGVSEFLSSVFQKDYRLISIIKNRQINEHPRYQGLVADNHKTNFTDCAQFLVISEASFEKTKVSLPTDKQASLDMGCFRGNITVKGPSPFEEDTWARFSIENIDFQGIGRCPRCKVTTVNQKTLEYDDNFEPVNTLRKLNGNGTKGYLGMHCVRHNNGEIFINSRVFIKETKKFPDI